MKRYNYRAKEQGTGKVVKGAIQAESERAAGKLLIDRGYIPDSLREVGTSVFDKLNRVTTKDRITFTRQFATLVGAGLPLAQSLRTISEQTSSKPMKAVIDEILSDVEAGRSLGEAFGKHEDVFSNVYLSLIRAGEVSGTLDESLRRIAAQEEKDERMMSKIRGALTYPVIVLFVIAIVFIYMMVEVVPQVESLYHDLKKDLPTFTLILVNIKNFIFSFWWLVLVVMGVIVALIMQFRKTETGHKFFATFKLNVPMFNSLFRLLYMARFTRTAQILLATGVSVLDTMKISGEAMNNPIVEKSITAAAEEVQAGKALSVSLKDKDYILPMVHQMAAIGEQSGKMDEMLGKAAQVLEDELDEKVAALSAMIEPLTMLGLAGMAGILVAGVLFPIYSLVGSIG
jgi:type IV pilus assembly protein PilC